MIFNVISEAASRPWMIQPETMSKLMPLYRDVLSGKSLGDGNEPTANIPFTQNIQMNDDGDAVSDSEQVQPVVSVVPMRGVMFKNDQECGPRGTKTIGRRLQSFDSDPSVIGHVLIIESPGGTSQSVDAIVPIIQNLKKPIVVWVDGMMCSAALYVGVVCNEIIASQPTDYIGSIGTMWNMSGRKAKSEANMFGEVEVTVYADGSDEKNIEHEKAINDFDFTEAKKVLNKLNERFQSTVKANRPNTPDALMHGRTYEAQDVVGTLIDSIGSLDDAVSRVVALSDYKPNSQQSNKAQTAKVNNSNTIIVMKQFQKVNSLLGVEQLESNDEGVFLNEEQLGTIDQTLNTNESELASAQTQMQEAVTAREAAETAQQTAEGTVASTLAALNELGPTVAAAPDATAKVAAIQTLLAAKVAQAPEAIHADDTQEEQVSDGWTPEQKALVDQI